MQRTQKIGFFDSGLGGLYIARAVRAALPDYDYLYLGDTLHVPYGRRSDTAIYDLCRDAMQHLFAQGCDLIVMACNTASAACLRRLQQEFLVQHYPDKRILGVIVPTLEVAIEQGARQIGMLATHRTVHSSMYEVELKKINPAVELHAVASPLLVPLIEYDGAAYYDQVLRDYLKPLQAAAVESLILGCTHYVAVKEHIARIMGADVALISQDDIIPEKFADYLDRHPEYERLLSKGGSFTVQATDLNESFVRNIQELVPPETAIEEVSYPSF